MPVGVCVYVCVYMVFLRYKGHKNNEYKVDCCLSHDDATIVCGAEDGKIWFWDLVEVRLV